MGLNVFRIKCWSKKESFLSISGFLDVIMASWLSKKMSILLEKHSGICGGDMTDGWD
jgi:hypothetical protein